MTELADGGPPGVQPRGGVRRVLVMVCVATLVVTGLSGWLFYRSRHASVPLLSSAVALGADREGVGLPPGPTREPLIPGTRVLADAGERGRALAEEQRAWIAGGRVPATDPEHQDMLRTALLDIHTLLLPDGAAVAGWPQSWRYVWPRDASMIAAALSRTGHTDDAVQVLRFLQDRLPPGGVFQARYLPEGSGVPDRRGEQTDSTGWVLWATARVAGDLSDGVRRAEFLQQLRPLIDGSTRAALRLTGGPGALPSPSPDYWEVRDDRLSLGTAAPLAFGLEAAAELQTGLGDRPLAQAAGQRARVLRASIAEHFGKDGYPRYLGDDEPDASVAFLLPPFTDRADPAIVAAWRGAAPRMARPAGGLAPGAGWRNDGISWTPPTAIFALTAASIGDRVAADRWLTWLANHRTPYGALPEKVLSNGEPAGPAPLTWTAALVLLAADALAGGR